MICFWLFDIFIGCFAACVVDFEFLFCFDWLCLSEVMAEEVLSKFRGIGKVYLRHVKKSSKDVNDILETFLPDSNFDKIIRLNTLKTSKLNKIDKIKPLDEQLLSKLNEKDSEKELDQILTREDKYLHTISKVDLHLSKSMKKWWEKKKTAMTFWRTCLPLRAVFVIRHILCSTQQNVERHGFCDSSGQAYCAMVFIRVINSHWVSDTMWAAKCRLTPIKNFSISRLELISCLFLSKLITTDVKAVEEEVKVNKVFCWSDSQIVIWWIYQIERTWSVRFIGIICQLN